MMVPVQLYHKCFKTRTITKPEHAETDGEVFRMQEQLSQKKESITWERGGGLCFSSFLQYL